MICGVVSAASGSSEGNPYPGALASLDFITGDYWYGENQITAANAVDQTDSISASGLFCDFSDPNGVVNIIGDILTLLCTGSYTLVIEWYESIASSSSYPLALDDSADSDTIYINGGGDFVACYCQPNPGADRSVVNSGLTAAPAIRRSAITRVNSKLVMSTNGGAINSDATATSTPSLDKASFGGRYNDGFPNSSVYIRRLIIYTEQSDSALPGLSTV